MNGFSENMDRPRTGLNRRQWLKGLGSGCAGIALASLLHRDALASTSAWSPPTGISHFTPRAKNVIWLFMNGGVSHMESFDPKPMLNKYAGKTIAETPFADVQDPEKLAIERLRVPDANGNQRNEIYPLQCGFRKHGNSGIEVSDWFPHIAEHVDKMAFVRSMWTTDSNHGAQTQFHSGRHMNDGTFPNLGAWVHYGLGTLNENLPQFISMGRRPEWNTRDGHYLGPSHDAVSLQVDPQNPLDYANPEIPFSPAAQSIGRDLTRQLNQMRRDEFPDDPAVEARIRSYELAWRMQSAIPELFDFSEETQATQRMYGIENETSRPFGMKLLAARRFIEKGVRFIQIQHGGGGAGQWDAHGGLKKRHSASAFEVDQPIGGLLEDLSRRGLLDETLVVFATEFGRTPGSQNSDGRDHHIFGFSVWMAGGGLKQGIVHGATDELGFHAIENRHYVTDIHATILRQLGLDSRKLELPSHKRLEIDHGEPILDIIA